MKAMLNKKPLLVGANTGVQTTYLKQSNHTRNRLAKGCNYKKFFRNRLPNACDYYAQQFPNLKTDNQRMWVSVRCCFHDDTSPSLRINLITGAFRCFACGTKGGDILAFHQQLNGVTFKQALRFFSVWGAHDK